MVRFSLLATAGPISGSWPARVLGALVVCSVLTACETALEELPVQAQSDQRLRDIASLDVLRRGTLRVSVFDLDRALETETTGAPVLTYSLDANSAVVGDTDIRGMLDGQTKYGFNQGTSYHMRVGRRIGGQYRGELELKRSLVKWSLPPLPEGASISSVRMALWVEGFSTDSPLRRERAIAPPLHLYVYPITDDWLPGAGGVDRNSFSAAATGEASWTHARAGERAWQSPGGLSREHRPPLATAPVSGDDGWIEFANGSLAEYLRICLAAGRTFDVLLKLDDQSEDRWGTEVALLTSEFGNRGDVVSKNPRLEFDVVLPHPARVV
jgi:hypothetical protein